jgi:hypothetical protein
MPEPGRGDTAGEDAALDTVMKAAVLLQESGQSTSMTMVAVDWLNMGVGIRSALIPWWASLVLAGPHPGVPVRVASVSPVGVRKKRHTPGRPYADCKSVGGPGSLSRPALLRRVTRRRISGGQQEAT